MHKFLPLLAFALLFNSCITSKSSQRINNLENTGSIAGENTETDEKLDNVSLDEKIGQMILVGINDRTVLKKEDALRKEIANGKMGGILLFEKNVAKSNSKATLKNLISDMQDEASTPLFISIDEEGGMVHRLKAKYGFFDIPGAADLGKLNNTDTTYFYYKKLAALLSELGINLNFAPTVDLALNPSNPVIAKVGRSYSANPEIVTEHAIAAIKAHHSEDVKTVIKHFPGHGSSTTDSHLGITDVTNLWKVLEIFPYNQIMNSGVTDAIMTAHIINCHLDTACLPATLSKTIVTGLLRNVMDYQGVVFSDDMQMYAISKNYGMENAVEMAINAGVDVIMFGNNVNLNDRITATEIHSIIRKLVDQGKINPERINQSYQRIMKLKKKKV